MAETSRPQVTITLGRSGQVVKRTGAELDSDFSNSHPSVGSKRSVHDRLGTNVELNNKRHRGDGNRVTASSADGVDDVHLRKDDLRYKIMRKTGTKRSPSDGQRNGVDLRQMLSRPARPSTTSLGGQQLMPEAKNARQHMPDRNEVRQRMPETREVRERVPGMREVRERVPETREYRERMPETREYRERMPETREYRERMPEMREYRERVPETREYRERLPETREVRERVPESREFRERIPVTREIRERMPEARDFREPIPGARDDRLRMAEARDDRKRIPEPTSANLIGRVPSTRAVEVDSVRNSYSPWTLDRLSRRSPDGVSGTSRVASPQRIDEESRRRPIIRAYDDVRTAPYLSKDGIELSSRPMGSTTASYMAKSGLAAAPAKPVAPILAAPPPPGVIVHRNPYAVEEQQSVDSLLLTLGLGKYIINFKAEEVDMHALRQMGDNDLKQLGIPMGPRKKILLALFSRSRRQV